MISGSQHPGSRHPLRLPSPDRGARMSTMKTIACSIAALLVASPTFGQTPPQTRPSDSQALTRALNAAPPATIVTPPASRSDPGPNDTPVPAAVPAPPAPTPPRPRPQPVPAVPAAGAIPARPLSQPSPASEPVAAKAVSSAATPRPATAAESMPGAMRTVPPTASPSESTPPAAPESATPAPTLPRPLDAAALGSLPFTVILPTGFQLTSGRPGSGFNVYTVRRGAQPFVMIYAGPSSQFPIYSGEIVQAAGRASVVTVEGSQRRAVEHLFQRPTSPSEIHIWVSSLEGADRIMAEQIAQSVDLR